ncbi:6315_t:CDS:2, partial [Gigaspora rosea]
VLENMWSKRSQRDTLRDKTNDMPVPKTAAASIAPSKKRKTLRPHRIGNWSYHVRLIERVELEELSLPPKSLELPKLIQSYLAENPVPNSNEDDGQMVQRLDER